MNCKVSEFLNSSVRNTDTKNEFVPRKQGSIDINFELSNRGKSKLNKKVASMFVSPKIEGRIEIKRGLWIVPRVKFKTEKERDEWILEKKLWYGII